MIIGIGNDIVEIIRIQKACQNEKFKYKYFTEKEILQAEGRPSFFAANFSAKESVSKAFGTGIRGFDLCDIEILRDERGKPFVNLYNGALKLSKDLGVSKIFVSISDTETIVTTTAVAEGG